MKQAALSSAAARLGSAGWPLPGRRRVSRQVPRLPAPVRAQAPPPGSGRLETVHSDDLAVLERLYLTVNLGLPPAAITHFAAEARRQEAAPAQQQQPQQQRRRHRHHRRKQAAQVEEVCGKLVCVEHVLLRPSRSQHLAAPAGEFAVPPPPKKAQDADGSPAAAGEAAPTSAMGMLAAALDMLPVSARTRGIVMLNVLVLLVATNWVVVKDVGTAFDPLGFAFLRFLVAAAAFSPFLKAAAKDQRILRAGMELGMWTAAGYITQSLGLLTTDASRASFLSTFTVLVVPFLAGMTGKGVSPITWASACCALLGVGLLEQNGAAPGVGDVWSMLSAVAFGIQIFRTEHWARILGNNANLSLMSVVLTTTMGFAALATGTAHWGDITHALQHPESLGHMAGITNFPWQQVLYCGLLTTDLALLLEVLALQDVSSTEAAIIYTLEPVLGATFAWAMLGERLGPIGMVGAGIIVCSSLATQIFGGGGDKGDGSGSSGSDSESGVSGSESEGEEAAGGAALAAAGAPALPVGRPAGKQD